MDLIKRILEQVQRVRPVVTGAGEVLSSRKIFEGYETRAPHPQHAVDLIPGWSSAFPAWTGVTAGHVGLFEDARVAWACDQFGDLSGKTVLELGPLEAGHTAMLEQRGAEVTAVEANKLAFLKCLIAKEIMGLTRARFLLGDFVGHLDASDVRYDMIFASGVLYHMKDPIGLLKRIAERTDALFVWTVCFPDDLPHQATRVETIGEEEIDLFQHSYQTAANAPAFCGGPEAKHYWIRRDHVIKALKALGFDDVRTTGDDEPHPFGSTLTAFARRTSHG